MAYSWEHGPGQKAMLIGYGKPSLVRR